MQQLISLSSNFIAKSITSNKRIILTLCACILAAGLIACVEKVYITTASQEDSKKTQIEGSFSYGSNKIALQTSTNLTGSSALIPTWIKPVSNIFHKGYFAR